MSKHYIVRVKTGDDCSLAQFTAAIKSLDFPGEVTGVAAANTAAEAFASPDAGHGKMCAATFSPLLPETFLEVYNYPTRSNVMVVRIMDGDIEVGGMICTECDADYDPFLYIAKLTGCRLNDFIDDNSHSEGTIREFLERFPWECVSFNQDDPDMTYRMMFMYLKDLFSLKGGGSATYGVVLEESKLAELHWLEDGIYLVGIM